MAIFKGYYDRTAPLPASGFDMNPTQRNAWNLHIDAAFAPYLLRDLLARRCIEEQEEADFYYSMADVHRTNGNVAKAVLCQLDARDHAEQAMVRLNRLIGVE